jgi:hypothetical protein
VNLQRVARHVAMASHVMCMACWPILASAQDVSKRSAQLPPSVLLSDVEISLINETGDGCVGRCVVNHITVRGDGVVELEDLGTPPRAATQRRSITTDEVASLVNEFLRARFFDALDRYDTTAKVVRRENELLLRFSGGIGGGAIDLNMRLGQLKKTVRLSGNVPEELRQLVEMVRKLGGLPPLPQTWPPK